MIRVPSAKITQLASLDLHSRDIDACALLDSKENIVKTVSQHLKWRIWDFLRCSMLVWQLFFSCWKWRELFSLYNVLNLTKRKFLTIVYWACVLFSSLARLHIFVLFCFGLSACLLFFFHAFLSQNKSSSYACRTLNKVTACNKTNGLHVCTWKPEYVGDRRNCTGTVNSFKSLLILVN